MSLENLITKNKGLLENLLVKYEIDIDEWENDWDSISSQIGDDLMWEGVVLAQVYCHYIGHGQGAETYSISVQLLIGKFDLKYWILFYDSEEDIGSMYKFNFFDSIPLQECYDYCKAIFNWGDTLINGYVEYGSKESKEFKENYSLDLDLNPDFKEYLKRNKFDLSGFEKILKKLDDLDL